MREILQLNIGQAGIQIGNECLALHCLEHNINTNGTIDQNQEVDEGIRTLFSEISENRYQSRSICLDLEPTVMDQVRQGEYKLLYGNNTLINSKEDSADNYSRGKYTIGKEVIDKSLQTVRKEAEKCDNFSGFQIIHSISGGTGSGLNSLLMERLHVDFPKQFYHTYTNFPGPKFANNIVFPYNAVLGLSSLIEIANLTTFFDNEQLYQLLNQDDEEEYIGFQEINRMVAQLISSVTATERLGGVQGCSTNMVPYPRIHFMLASSIPTGQNKKISPSCQLKQALDSRNIFSSNILKKSKMIACASFIRGNIVPYDIIESANSIKKQLDWVDWVPTGMQVTSCPLRGIIRSGGNIIRPKQMTSCLINSTAVGHCFSGLKQKFDLMYAKRAFVHWFVGEGMESGEFSECRENMVALEKDYEWEEFVRVDLDYYDE